ncbi:MAG TPA: hypothetical protein VHU17_01150 [Acidimicrobiales bacterium]|jgi:hypothetical protein|nr:hypothetical protein [Acidimicrobiales bacterium]
MSPEPAIRVGKAASSAPVAGARGSVTGKSGRSGTYKVKAAGAKASGGDVSNTGGKASRGIGKSAPTGGGTTKISVTVPTEVLAEVRDLGPDNLSAVVADALRQWSASTRLGRMLDELDATYGPVPPDIAAEVEAEWGPIFDRSAARRTEGPRA